MTVADYLRSVSFELGALSWRQRQDLLAELPAHTDLDAGLERRGYRACAGGDDVLPHRLAAFERGTMWSSVRRPFVVPQQVS
jgi:hypothetical protein